MEGFMDRRSPRLVWGVTGTLLAGFVFALLLPAVTVRSDYDGSSVAISLTNLDTVLNPTGIKAITHYSEAWVLVAIAAAVGFPKNRRRLQGIVITASSLNALYLPLAVRNVVGPGAFGSGLLILTLACIAAAILPWVLPKLESTIPRELSSGVAVQTSTATTVAPARPDASKVGVASRYLGPFQLSPTSGAPGTTVRATARGFKPGEPVSINAVDASGSVSRFASSVASSLGEIDLSFTVPADLPPGACTLRVEGSSGVRWSRTFTISGVPVEASPTTDAPNFSSPCEAIR